MNSTKYYVVVYDFTEFGNGMEKDIQYHITTTALDHKTAGASCHKTSLGEFDTLAQAHRATAEDAGEDGLCELELTGQAPAGLAAAYRRGRNGLLTAGATRAEWGEWSLELALGADPTTFPSLVEEARRSANSMDEPLPDAAALLALLKEDHAEFLRAEEEAGQ